MDLLNGSVTRSHGDPRRAVAIATITALVTLALSLVPVPGERRRFGPYGPDKWPHVGAHALLATAVAESVGPDRDDHLAATIGVAVSMAFGALVEALQDAVPWRTGEGTDVAAGTVGALFGGLVWLLGRRPIPVPSEQP